jgi:hypothetical protein
VVAPTTHARAGVASTRALLRGTVAVVPGTAAFAAVVATALDALGTAPTFGLALAVMLTVNRLIDAADRRGGRSLGADPSTQDPLGRNQRG